MSINNEKKIEPVTELGLALGYSDQRRRFMSNDYSGAGANAGPGINMTFVTNTLSELVWSPLKGPSNVALLPAHRISSTAATKTIPVHNDKDFVILSSLHERKSRCGQTSAGPKLTQSGACDNDVRDDKITDTRENQPSTFSGHRKDKVVVEVMSGSPVDEERKRFDKIESTSENELERNPQNVPLLVQSETPHKSKVTCQTSKAVIRVIENRAKGKEKALSEGDQINTMTSKNDYNNDNNDSHESVESCNSAGLFAAGKRRRNFEDQGLISGSSKGTKKQMVFSGGRDSSFMNWISNVMKGFSHSAQEQQPLPLRVVGPIIEDRDDPIKVENREPKNVIGFQSIFQSIYCSKAEAQEARETRVLVGDESDPDGDNVGKQLVVLSGNSYSNLSLSNQREMKSDDESVPQSLGKTTTTTTSSKVCQNRNDALGSFWITRFSPRTRDANIVVEEEERLVLPVSEMSINKLNPILPLPASKPSEATTSVFARRLDAIKHAATSSRVCEDTRMTCLCFFCGAKGHVFGDCSQVKETEREELMRNLNSFGNVEEFPSCLCVKCSKCDHWAVSCPNKVETLVKEMQIDQANKENLENKKLLRFGDQSAAPLKEKKLCYVSSSFVENIAKVSRIIPLPFVTSGVRNEDAPRDLFDVMRRLRLSRSDIIKWTDSQMSLSHIDGLFLRLRLGKWEEGLGGTGYHVACIIGTQKEEKQKGVKSSLLVKVGGMKCVVESRYISNNDFLEDELMAWWCISSRTGDKIPSEEDLRKKVKTKTKLGF